MAEFYLQPTTCKAGTKYFEMSLNPCQDISSFLRPLVLMRSLGKVVNYGTLFAYLFHRFGAPNTGWDEDKCLCMYVLSTPLPDMVLQVSPSTCGNTFLHFRFMVTRKVYQEMEDYDQRDYRLWQNRMFDWIEQEGLLPDWMDEYLAQFQRDIAPVKTWRQAFGTLSAFVHMPDGDPKSFVGRWQSDILDQYRDIEPQPQRNWPTTEDWTCWPDEYPRKKYYQAAYEALLDLKEPVFVRDTAINIFGEMKGEMP